MKTLSSVQCGIKALEGVLNRVVAGINQRTIYAGAGITVKESDDGVVIARAQKDDDKGQTGNQTGGTGGVAAGPGSDGQWMTVTVVDPATCAQSQIQVWAKPVG